MMNVIMFLVIKRNSREETVIRSGIVLHFNTQDTVKNKNLYCSCSYLTLQFIGIFLCTELTNTTMNLLTVMLKLH